MIVKRALLVTLALLATASPGEAAKRSVHYFGERFVFNFSRDFVFTDRENTKDGQRQINTFRNGNSTIVIAASRYDPASTEPLTPRDEFIARAAAEGSTHITYLNEETDAGRGGSHIIGVCKKDTCIYNMSRAIGEKYWLTLRVSCETCTDRQAEETRTLAGTLYGQLKKM